MSWDYKILNELGTVSRGRSRHRPRNDNSLFGGKYPFVQTADVKAANFYLTDYTETYNEKGLEQSRLWKAGTLCITIAANIADTAILGIDACFPDSIMGFVPFEGVSNAKFIKYAFDMLQRDIKQISQGTAQDNLSWQKLEMIKFPAPDIKIQNKIVEILGTFDDLIENNQKQIKILEEAAQRLYKEWFIDLRFPGYEETEIIDGVPKDWEKKLIGDIIGKIPRTKQIKTSDYLSEGAIPVVDQSRDFIAGYTNDKDSVVNLGIPIIVFGDHTRILKYIQFPFAKGADGTQLIISDKDNMPQSLLYLSLKAVDLSNYHYARHFKYLKAEIILVPTQEIGDKFDRIVLPMLNRIQKLRDICNKSSQARDRLLPKLLSGEIEV